jgi:hypothetical protein
MQRVISSQLAGVEPLIPRLSAKPSGGALFRATEIPKRAPALKNYILRATSAGVSLKLRRFFAFREQSSPQTEAERNGAILFFAKRIDFAAIVWYCRIPNYYKEDEHMTEKTRKIAMAASACALCALAAVGAGLRMNGSAPDWSDDTTHLEEELTLQIDVEETTRDDETPLEDAPGIEDELTAEIDSETAEPEVKEAVDDAVIVQIDTSIEATKPSESEMPPAPEPTTTPEPTTAPAASATPNPSPAPESPATPPAQTAPAVDPGAGAVSSGTEQSIKPTP